MDYKEVKVALKKAYPEITDTQVRIAALESLVVALEAKFNIDFNISAGPDGAFMVTGTLFDK